jgi:hypothetical protein
VTSEVSLLIVTLSLGRTVQVLPPLSDEVSVTGFQTGSESIPMVSLEEELDRLRRIAARLGRGREEEQIGESILGISLYVRHLAESHAMELTQLRDEIRILHDLLSQRDTEGKKSRGSANGWRTQLQRRAAVEAGIRSVLVRGETCATVCVPIPSPLSTQSGTESMDRFLTEIAFSSIDKTEGLSALWTTRVAVVWRPDADALGGNSRILPEVARVGDLNYVLRSRAWEVISFPGESVESYLKRIDESGRSVNAS